MKYYKILILWLSLSIVCSACQKKKPAYQPKVDTKEVKEIAKSIDTKVFRYELALQQLSPDSLQYQLNQMRDDYAFLLGDTVTAAGARQISNYLKDPTIKKLYKQSNKVFADFAPYKEAFDSAFTLMKYYFPQATIPRVYTVITGLYYEMPIMCYDSAIVVSLDLYLGSNYPIYKQLGPNVPQYIYRRFAPEYLLPDCFKELAYNYIDFPQATSVLDEMLIDGKRMLFAQLLLPNTADTLIFGYPHNKLQWAVNNESIIWSYLINNNLLYNKNKQTIRELIGEKPFTSYFGNNSPGKIGSWIGWQICRSWIANNPDKPISDMLLEKDSQKILNESKYKPKK
ncbi:MAG: hypothetical protein J5725_03685 [Bacteroidales bacterium]|nr:hypothetical protein [Bacteroidales bacterium]